jgi:hypothetical protein
VVHDGERAVRAAERAGGVELDPLRVRRVAEERAGVAEVLAKDRAIRRAFKGLGGVKRARPRV